MHVCKSCMVSVMSVLTIEVSRMRLAYSDNRHPSRPSDSDVDTEHTSGAVLSTQW